MTKSQIEACKRRITQLRQAIDAGGTPGNAALQQACSDIDALIIDLETMTERARQEQEEQKRLRRELAEQTRHNHDLERTVGPLRDKLSKARRLLTDYSIPNPTAQDKRDIKDIMKEV